MKGWTWLRGGRRRTVSAVQKDLAASYAVLSGTATAFTLSGPSSGTTGIEATFTVTPNGVLGSQVIVTLGAPGATLNVPTLTFNAGSNSPQTFGVTRAVVGSTDVSIASSLAEIGSPITFVASAPAAAGDLNTSFTLASASSGTKEFTIGHAFKQAEVPTSYEVAVAGASAQVTPKNYWPDGSLKYAIVAGTYSQPVGGNPVTVTLTKTAAVAPPTPLALSQFKAAMVGQTCSIACGAFGSASWSGTDWDTPHQAWVSGHRMSSWVYRKPVGADAHLVAWLEVRYYASGAVEVLPWIENGYLNVAGPTNKSATYTFTLGGTQRYSGALDLPHHTRTVLLDGTKLSHWLGTDPAVTVKHDVEYMQATTLVPAYDAVVSPSAPSVTRQPTSFTPLIAPPAMDNTDAMGAGGYGNHVALLPEWDVLYLTTSADVWKAVQWTHYSMGRYAIHYRDETTNKPLAFSTYNASQLSLYYPAADSLLGMKDPGSGSTTTPVPTGTSPAGQWARSHQPSVGFMPYLMTGRYYFLEECQFAATANYLGTGGSYREGTSVFNSRVEATRGFAWDFRTLAQAACITPDSGDALRTEFINSIATNITFYRNAYANPNLNQFGFISNVYVGGDTDDRTGADGKHWMSVFMQEFATSAVGYAKDLMRGHMSGTVQGYWDAFFAFMAQSVTGRMGGAGATEWLYRSAAPYNLAIASADDINTMSAAAPYYASWGAAYDATYSGALPDNGSQGEAYAPNFAKAVGGNLGGGDFGTTSSGSTPSGYWGYMQPALAYVVRNESTPSLGTNGYMKQRNAPNWYLHKEAHDPRPVHSVLPRALPKWRRGVAVNQWVEISGSSMSNPASAPSSYQQIGGSNIPNRVNNWNGYAIDTRTNTLWGLGNGGHGDYFGNEVMKLDLTRDAPVWVEWLPPTPYTGGTEVPPVAASPRHLNDPTRLSGQHSYYNHMMLHRQDRVLRVYSGSVSSGAGTGFWDVDGFNVNCAQGASGSAAFDAVETFPKVYPDGTSMSHASGICKNPDTEEIYFFPAENGVVRKFTPASSGIGGSWASIGSLPALLNGTEAMTAYDSRRNRILVCGIRYSYDSNDMRFHYLDATNNTWSAELTSTMTGAAKATLIAMVAGGGMVYVPALDAYLVRRGRTSGAEVIKINASTWECSFLSVSGGSGIVQTNSLGWPAGYENVYHKWLFVPELRGVVYYPEYSSNLWFLRLY